MRFFYKIHHQKSTGWESSVTISCSWSRNASSSADWTVGWLCSQSWSRMWCQSFMFVPW